MNGRYNDNNKNDEDLDAFLTTIESKLRGPFSSLDLSKAVTANALRGSLTPSQYLQNLSKVLARTDKVIQSRMLIGLLGLEPAEETADIIHDILQQAQEAPQHEEWVRTIAGLIQGIMFRKPGDKDGHETAADEEEDSFDRYYPRSCRGAEAQSLIDKIEEEVFQKLDAAIEESLKEDELPPDLNASYVPYRYTLQPQSVIKELFPEVCGKNPHFKSNMDADILKVDERLEAQRAKEEQEHRGPVLMKTKVGKTTAGGGSAKKPGDFPPGFRPTKLVNTGKGSASSGSSMFMPKKTNPMLAQRQRQLQQKTMLRRKGAAQALVNNSSLKQRLAKAGGAAAGGARTGTLGGATKPTLGRAGKFGGASSRAMASKSKMKMIDVEEVDSLAKERAAREEAANSRLSKKRRIMDAAKQMGLKKAKSEAVTPSPQPTAAPAPAPSKPEPTAEAAAPPAPSGDEPEWKILLRERSNKLSDDDRQRVQQFFEHRYNPTPDQDVVKMKLHEERSNDPATGQAIKETFYLELNYNTFKTHQTKKIKRY